MAIVDFELHFGFGNGQLEALQPVFEAGWLRRQVVIYTTKIRSFDEKKILFVLKISNC